MIAFETNKYIWSGFLEEKKHFLPFQLFFHSLFYCFLFLIFVYLQIFLLRYVDLNRLQVHMCITYAVRVLIIYYFEPCNFKNLYRLQQIIQLCVCVFCSCAAPVQKQLRWKEESMVQYCFCGCTNFTLNSNPYTLDCIGAACSCEVWSKFASTLHLSPRPS